MLEFKKEGKDCVRVDRLLCHSSSLKMSLPRGSGHSDKKPNRGPMLSKLVTLARVWPHMASVQDNRDRRKLM